MCMHGREKPQYNVERIGHQSDHVPPCGVLIVHRISLKSRNTVHSVDARKVINTLESQSVRKAVEYIAEKDPDVLGSCLRSTVDSVRTGYSASAAI